MIFTNVKKKPLEYAVLFFIIILGAVMFFVFYGNPHTQRRIIYATSAGYFFWSLYHHYRRGDLQFSIIIEYLLFALLAIIVISSTVF